MKFNVHGGHNAHVTGASKYLNELNEDRKVKNEVIRLLKAQGHTVYDCTDDSGKSQSVNLSNIVKKCNAHAVDLDVSIHLNAGGGTGVECWIYPNSASKTEASRICSKIASALGIKNRGVKTSSSLYVLKNTKADAVLVECCFVDSTNDRDKWNATKCAKAIVEGILNKTISTSTNTSKPSASTSTNFLIKVSGVSKGDVLNVRESASASSKITDKLEYNDPNKYTIVATKKVGSETWGKLKSDLGWINLRYTKRV